MPLTPYTWPGTAWLPCPEPGCHSPRNGPTLDVPLTVSLKSDEIQESGPFWGICTSCGVRQEGIALEPVRDAYQQQQAQLRGAGY